MSLGWVRVGHTKSAVGVHDERCLAGRANASAAKMISEATLWVAPRSQGGKTPMSAREPSVSLCSCSVTGDG